MIEILVLKDILQRKAVINVIKILPKSQEIAKNIAERVRINLFPSFSDFNKEENRIRDGPNLFYSFFF